MRRHRWKAVLGLVVTVALLVWVFRDVSAAEILDRVRRSHPGWLAGAVVAATFVFVPRAARWQVLLLPRHPSVPFRSRFGAVCIGFMVNNVLPARLGEFARAYSLSRIEPVSMSAAFGSLVVERVFDGFVLAGLLALVLAGPGTPMGGTGSGEGLVRNIALVAAALFTAAAVVLALLVRHPDTFLRWFERTLGRVLPPHLTERGTEVLASFTEGLGALHDLRVFLRATVWTIAVWLILAASIWCGLRAFDIDAPGFTGAVFVQAVIGFSVAIPSSPGFFGPFEAAARLSLGLYAIDPATIVAFAGTYHVLTFIPVTLMGLWYLHRLGLRWSEMGRSEEVVEGAIESDSPEEIGTGGATDAGGGASRAGVESGGSPDSGLPDG